MCDPTLTEMRDFLCETFGIDPDAEFDREEAIYWFATHNHSGQSSDLYIAICQSPYNPGPLCHGPDSNTAVEMYNALTAEYRQQ